MRPIEIKTSRRVKSCDPEYANRNVPAGSFVEPAESAAESAFNSAAPLRESWADSLEWMPRQRPAVP